MDKWSSRTRRRFRIVLATLAAAVTALSVVPIAVAMRSAVEEPTVETSSPGQSTGDFNKDGYHDIVARDAATGDLKVYLHSGTYQGTGTYLPPEVVGHGWSSMRWIGQGRLTRLSWQADQVDVIAIDEAGRLILYPNSRCGLCGTRTFEEKFVIDESWGQIHSLVTVADVTGDNYDDLVARRADIGDTYVYPNIGGVTGGDFGEPELLATNRDNDVAQAMADVTLDGERDLVFVQNNGVLGAHSFVDDKTYVIGHGWNTINTVIFANVDGERGIDILGRRAADGALLAYTHTGVWDPQPDGTALTSFAKPEIVGHNWHINDLLS